MKLNNKFYPALLWDADKGTGGGDPTPATSAETKKPETSSEEKTVPLSRFNEINNKLKELERTLSAKTEAEQAAEKKRLEEQQQWETLAKQHEAKVTELSPKVEALSKEKERLDAAVKAQLKAQIDKVPKVVRSLLEKMDPVDQLEWLAANQDELGNDAKVTPKGVPPVPKPTAGQNGDEKANLRARQKAIVQRSF